MSEDTSLLDQINAEVAALSDEEIATAAAAIQARKEREKARMTPDAKEKMKVREARRRKLNAAILAEAKRKGLVGETK